MSYNPPPPPYRPPRPRNEPMSSKDDFKVDIPEFFGHIDIDEYFEWVRTIERAFDYKCTPKEKKVKVAALKFKKYASVWWENVCDRRFSKGKEKLRSWDKLKKKMEKKFVPRTYREENYAKLHHLEQGKNTVQYYAREFEELIIKCNLKENEHQTMVRFLEGLNDDIKHIVELQSYKSLRELILLAHKVERQQKNKSKVSSRAFAKTSTTFDKTKPYTSYNRGNTSNQPSNNSKGFTAQNSSSNQNSKTQVNLKGPKKCYKCQGFGHMSYDYPNTKVISLMEYEEMGEEEVELGGDEGDVEGEVELGPDEGECLVIRRALSIA